MSATSAQAPNGTPGRLLVVDDHPLNRMLLKDALERAGYEVLEAEDGPAALSASVTHGPDVILLDVMMPDMDGFEVCRRLKAEPRTAALPVLMVTALTDRDNRIKGIEAGANDFISKPLDTVELLLRVRNVVATKRLFDQFSGAATPVLDMSSPLARLGEHLEHLQRSLRDHANPEALAHLAAARDAVAKMTAGAGAAFVVPRPQC